MYNIFASYSLSVPNIQVVCPKPWTYYIASYPNNSIYNEKETLIASLASLDLDLVVGLVSPSMGALESHVPPIGPSGCLFQDVVLPYDEDLLESMLSVDVPLDDIVIVLSNDHIFELDYLAIEPNTDFSSNFDLIISESSDIGIDEY